MPIFWQIIISSFVSLVWKTSRDNKIFIRSCRKIWIEIATLIGFHCKMTPNDLNMTSKESHDPGWPLKTWNSDSWQKKIKIYEEKTKQMEELEAKKRAKERLKKATMHREDIDEMRLVFKLAFWLVENFRSITLIRYVLVIIPYRFFGMDVGWRTLNFLGWNLIFCY